MTTELDPKRRAAQVARADGHRREAKYHEAMMRQAIERAQTIERVWEIPAPCKMCGQRGECSH